MHTCCTGDFALDDIQAVVVAGVPQSCTTQSNCATHNTNAACVLTSKYQCTTASAGYYAAANGIVYGSPTSAPSAAPSAAPSDLQGTHKVSGAPSAPRSISVPMLIGLQLWELTSD